VRFSLVLGVAMVLGRHFAADRGYWIPLTAALVLKPDFQTTFVRGFARIGGTIIGAVIATLLLAALRGHEVLEMAGILVAAAAAYLTFFPNYGLFTVAITSFVVLVLHLRGLPGTTTIESRLLDTLAGGTLAMIGYLGMPTWERRRTRALLADLLDAQCGHVRAILEQLAGPSTATKAAIGKTRNAAWRARTAAEASIDRSLHEPNRRHTIGPKRALRMLAAGQRLGLASLALETALDAPLDDASRSAIGEFAKALEERLHVLERALRDARQASEDDPLPGAYAKIEAMLSTASAPQDRFVAERLHAYVDAASSIARLIGSAQKPQADD
jgi:uncharacterized membrane protein YccC